MAENVDILEKHKRIDVICQHCCNGLIYPIRLRLTDSDGLRQEYTIREFIDKTIYTDLQLPNGIKIARSNIWKFDCKVTVFEHDRWISILYNASENVWRLI